MALALHDNQRAQTWKHQGVVLCNQPIGRVELCRIQTQVAHTSRSLNVRNIKKYKGILRSPNTVNLHREMTILKFKINVNPPQLCIVESFLWLKMANLNDLVGFALTKACSNSQRKTHQEGCRKVGFRATLTFRKFKVALNPTYSASFTFPKNCTLSCVWNIENIKKFHLAVFEL